MPVKKRKMRTTINTHLTPSASRWSLVFQQLYIYLLLYERVNRLHEKGEGVRMQYGWIHEDPNTSLEKIFLRSPGMWKRWKVAEKHF